MKVFHCDHCGHLVFFENTQCVSCGHVLAFLPDLLLVGSLDAIAPGESDGPWPSPLSAAAGRTYRLCANYADASVCNWAVRRRGSESAVRVVPADPRDPRPVGSGSAERRGTGSRSPSAGSSTRC